MKNDPITERPASLTVPVLNLDDELRIRAVNAQGKEILIPLRQFIAQFERHLVDHIRFRGNQSGSNDVA
jgi:peptide deformylase